MQGSINGKKKFESFQIFYQNSLANAKEYHKCPWDISDKTNIPSSHEYVIGEDNKMYHQSQANNLEGIHMETNFKLLCKFNAFSW